MSTTIGSPSNQHLIRSDLTGLVRSGRGQSKKSFLKAIYAIARTIGIKRRVILYDRCVSLSNFYLESYLEGKQRFFCGLILYRQFGYGRSWFPTCLLCYSRLKVRQESKITWGGFLAVECFVYLANLLFTNSFRQIDVSELQNSTLHLSKFYVSYKIWW